MLDFIVLLRKISNCVSELVSSNRVLYGNHLWTRKSLKNAAENNIELLSFESKIRFGKNCFSLSSLKSLILNVSVNPDRVKIPELESDVQPKMPQKSFNMHLILVLTFVD